LIDNVEQVIRGKHDQIRLALCCLLTEGHLLLDDVPGTGKTTLAKAIANSISGSWSRVQFTPDLLPTDITGSHMLEEREPGRKAFAFHPGPVFTNLLLADEINRASPKTQAALLEAMQERRVTIFGETRPLPAPFFVLATQNPIELEGTYPLPEAQLDRFMFKVEITGVDRSVLEEILLTRVHGEPPPIDSVLTPADLQGIFDVVDAIHLPRAVASFIARLVASSHPSAPDAPEPVRTFVRYGSSPRGAIAIGAAARGLALLHGKPNVGFDDVRRVAAPALAHRLVLDYTARLEGWDGRRVVAALLDAVPEAERGLPQTLGAR
jgi:MoxR-like ATPase